MIPVVDGIIDHAKESLVAQFKEGIISFLLAALDVTKDLSFSIALLGGGVCIIVWAVTGMRRAGKAFGVLVLAHALIRFLLS